MLYSKESKLKHLSLHQVVTCTVPDLDNGSP